MAGSAHRAVRASAAAGGFPFFSAIYHADQNRRDNGNQHSADHDCCKIFRKPSKHFLSPVHSHLFRHFNAFGQFCRLVIALDEQHIHHHRKHGDCRNQTDDIQTAGKRRAKLVDHQANRIRKHALIWAGKALILLHFLTVSQKHYKSPKTQIFKYTMFWVSLNIIFRGTVIWVLHREMSIKLWFYWQKCGICKALSVKKDLADFTLQGQFFYCGFTNWVCPKSKSWLSSCCPWSQPVLL